MAIRCCACCTIPPPDATEGAIRAGAHEDINLITLLLGAEEAGLELLTKNGTWMEVAPPPGALVVNIGDMLQRLTNHVLPSTTHRVRNPTAQRAHSRYSMPFFLHLRSTSALKRCPAASRRKTPTAIRSRSRQTTICRKGCGKSV
jgi:isopenicillin N synthase-like dioxygenase